MIIRKKYYIVVFIMLLGTTILSAQNDSTISYDESKEYTIADIRVTGDFTYENYIIIGFSGLSVGDRIFFRHTDIGRQDIER